jgi:predicted small lipoprotein YifL
MKISSNPVVVKSLWEALLAMSLVVPLAGCGDKEPPEDSDLPQCASPYDENAFVPFFPGHFCDWMRDCSPDTYDELACLDAQLELAFCHEADPCLTEACIVALDRDFEEAPDDCALVPAACDGIFNLDVDRCAE